MRWGTSGNRSRWCWGQAGPEEVGAEGKRQVPCVGKNSLRLAPGPVAPPQEGHLGSLSRKKRSWELDQDFFFLIEKKM